MLIRAVILRLLAVVAGFFMLDGGAQAATPSIAADRVVFGYMQIDYTTVPFIKWNAVTDIGLLQTSVNSTGNFTNLASTFTNRVSDLKFGGAADRAGVKVNLVVTAFGDTPGGTIETLMTSATNRTNLINNILAAVNDPTNGCDGVSFDFEFNWSWNTTDTIKNGLAQFFTDLRAALPSKQISAYVTPASMLTHMWDVPNLATNCDFVLQTGYDYGNQTTVHAVSDYDSNLSAIASWVNAGLPPEKTVYTLSAYGFNRTGVTTYGGTGSGLSSTWFADTLYDTTLRQTDGPFSSNYQTGDETAWDTYVVSGVNNLSVWDNEQSLEYKIRSTLGFNGTGAYRGRRLKGVGFWTLNRFVSSKGRDPFSGSISVNNNTQRLAPQIYQLCEEILSERNATKFVFEKFESLNPHWDGFTNADDATRPSPDNVGVNGATTVRSIVTSPVGAGAPSNTNSAVKLDFNFSATPGKLFFRHELVNSSIDPTITDTNAACAKFTAANKLNAYVYVGGSGYPNNTVRLAVFDANRELEVSPVFSLSSAGWHLLTWDLTDTTAGNVTGLATTEPTLVSGDGVLDTGGNGARDIGFLGFIVDRGAGGAASGSLYFDELSYEPTTPAGGKYTINEFCYADDAREFVEIKGPVGAFPTSMELRFYLGTSTTGNPTIVSLAGKSIPASGLFVVGDTGVPNVNFTPAGWSSASDISNARPGGIQLVQSSTSAVYDSVAYGTTSGLKDLMRSATLGVTNEGQGWMGDTGASANLNGEGLAFGRDATGTDTNNNEEDFSLLPVTPGTANGTSLSLPFSMTFASVPSQLHDAFQTPAAVAMAAGRPASSNGGSVYRCVDTTGGGDRAQVGDFTLGSTTNGYNVTGELYIPPPTDPSQGLGVGFCAKSGSNFFPTTLSGGAYDTGYWLTYETAAGVGLNDDQPDHAQEFQFLMAKNDNVGTTRTIALGTIKTLADVGIASLSATGQWVPFRLSVNTLQNLLLAEVNGVQVYKGSIPSDGPTTGAFQVGFRENNGTGVTSVMGTWIDNIQINTALVPVSLTHLSID